MFAWFKLKPPFLSIIPDFKEKIKTKRQKSGVRNQKAEEKLATEVSEATEDCLDRITG